MGGTDIELRLGRGHWPGYEAQLLFHDRLVPVCSAETAQSLGAKASAQEIAKHPLVHVMGPEDQWSKFFAHYGVERDANPSDLGVDSSMAASEMTIGCDRITLMQEKLASRVHKSGRFVAMPNLSIRPDEAMYLLKPITTEPRNASAVLFENWLREHLES